MPSPHVPRRTSSSSSLTVLAEIALSLSRLPHTLSVSTPPILPNHELATFTAVLLLVVLRHAARTNPLVVVVLPQESFVSPLQRWKGHQERINTCCCCYCCYCYYSFVEDFCSRSSQRGPAAPGRRVASTGTSNDPQTGGGGLESSRVCGGQPTTTTTTATTATTTTTRIGISSSRFSTGCHCPRPSKTASAHGPSSHALIPFLAVGHNEWGHG